MSEMNKTHLEVILAAAHAFSDADDAWRKKKDYLLSRDKNLETIKHLRTAVNSGYIPGTMRGSEDYALKNGLIDKRFSMPIEEDTDLGFWVFDVLDNAYNPANFPVFNPIDFKNSKRIDDGKGGIPLVVGAQFKDFPENFLDKIIREPVENALRENTLQGENPLLATVEISEEAMSFMAKKMWATRGHVYETRNPDTRYWLTACDELARFVNEYFLKDFQIPFK